MKKTAILTLSKWQLINLRRFVNRGIACAEGRCEHELTTGWKAIEPVVRKIDEAYRRLHGTKKRGIRKVDQLP